MKEYTRKNILTSQNIEWSKYDLPKTENLYKIQNLRDNDSYLHQANKQTWQYLSNAAQWHSQPFSKLKWKHGHRLMRL